MNQLTRQLLSWGFLAASIFIFYRVVTMEIRPPELGYVLCDGTDEVVRGYMDDTGRRTKAADKPWFRVMTVEGKLRTFRHGDCHWWRNLRQARRAHRAER